MKSTVKAGGAARVRRHRARTQSAGGTRIEVTVQRADAGLVRAIAARLRGGGDAAASLRAALEPLVAAPRARSGAELLAFFRSAPLVGVELTMERDRSAGRKVSV